MKIFCTTNGKYLVLGIEEVTKQYKTTISDPEDPVHVHIISDEEESVMHNERSIR